MTIICAVHDPQRGETWYGGDGRMTMGDGIFPGGVVKWVEHGRRALGCCGDILTLNLVRAGAAGVLGHTTPHDVGMALRELMAEHGFQAEDRRGAGGATAYRQTFIYATVDGVWDIDGTGCATEAGAGRLWARGSGMDFALGADHAMRAIDPTLPPSRRVRRALEAAIEHDVGCGAPVLIRRVG